MGDVKAIKPEDLEITALQVLNDYMPFVTKKIGTVAHSFGELGDAGSVNIAINMLQAEKGVIAMQVSISTKLATYKGEEKTAMIDKNTGLLCPYQLSLDTAQNG